MSFWMISLSFSKICSYFFLLEFFLALSFFRDVQKKAVVFHWRCLSAGLQFAPASMAWCGIGCTWKRPRVEKRPGKTSTTFGRDSTSTSRWCKRWCFRRSTWKDQRFWGRKLLYQCVTSYYSSHLTQSKPRAAMTVGYNLIQSAYGSGFLNCPWTLRIEMLFLAVLKKFFMI